MVTDWASATGAQSVEIVSIAVRCFIIRNYSRTVIDRLVAVEFTCH